MIEFCKIIRHRTTGKNRLYIWVYMKTKDNQRKYCSDTWKLVKVTDFSLKCDLAVIKFWRVQGRVSPLFRGAKFLYLRFSPPSPQALSEKCRFCSWKWPNWPHRTNCESLDSLETAAMGRCKSKRLYRRARFQACEGLKALSRGRLGRKGEKNNFTENWLFLGNSLRMFEKVKKLFFAQTLKSKKFLTIRLAYRTRTEYVASNNRGFQNFPVSQPGSTGATSPVCIKPILGIDSAKQAPKYGAYI